MASISTDANGNAVVRPLRDNEKAPEFPGLSVSCRDMRNLTVAEAGLETSTDFVGNSTIGRQGDSQSDSLGGVVDPWLARLIEVWPALADDVKGEMLTLAGLRPYDVDDFNGVSVGDDHDRG